MKNAWYFFVRFWVKLAIKLFYRRIELNGTDQYPKSGPVFLAPNHQNAFMDALIPAVFIREPIHFLARSDVFKNKRMAAFLGSINMMPVYRQRDGLSNLAKNEEIFKKCRNILKSGGTLLIFPEATHLGERRVRPLSKGFTRVLFGTLEEAPETDINIVPLGINYSHYHKAGARLIVNFGKPISVLPYRADYEANPHRTMTALRDKVRTALSQEVIHLERKDANNAFEAEAEFFIPFFLHRTGGFSVDDDEMDFGKRREASLRALPEGHPHFRRMEVYRHEAERLKLRAPLFFIKRKDAGYWLAQSLLLLLMFPFFAGAWLMMAPSYLLIRNILTRYIADRQFWSSIKLVSYLVLFPLFGILLTAAAILISGRPLLSLTFVPSFYMLSVFIIRELRLPYRYLFTMWRSLLLKRRNPALLKYLTEIEREVLTAYRRL